MKTHSISAKGIVRKTISYFMAVAIVLVTVGTIDFVGNATNVSAATVITSMEYYDTANGATQSKSGVGEISFGTVLPKFNGKPASELCIDDVQSDFELLVKQDTATGGQWKNIDTVSSFTWNDNFAWEKQEWAPGVYGWIFWTKITETTEFKFHGKTNNVELTYTFNVTQLEKFKLTSISTTETNITANATGGSATHWGQWTFNGDKNIKYKQVEDDIKILVDNNDGKGFVNFLGNASSGFLWDQNFGYYSDGDGGYWFTNISWSFTLRFQSKSNASVYQDVKVTYTEPVRSSYTLASYDGITDKDASTDAGAAVGIVLPKIGGTECIKKDLDLFKYEVMVGNEWIPLTDVAASGWVYQGNGLNHYSRSQQWGYFVDGVYGLWFQPVLKDTKIKISYPIDGKKGGDSSNNYVIYSIKGNPSYEVQLPSDMSNITIENSSNPYTPSGWKMIWNDEFDGSTLDTSKWNYQEGYLLEEDNIDTWGWGNQELEYYTRDNVSVSNGSLNILMKKQSKVFAQSNDPSKKVTAKYSSGKITTQNNFSVKYGRVDFRAKMPTGKGVWPAMWMLSNDTRYGSWPLSGEIDVFEGRGRTPNMVFGTLHYGSQWPNNLNTSDVFNMETNGITNPSIADWHVYSVIWEADNIKIYCDGKCYFKCSNADWYTGSDRGNANAPFDQRFYLILNLAAGGTFDSGYVPDESFTEGTMLVDYVRVYQRQVAAGADEKPDNIPNVSTDGKDDNLYGDYKLGSGTSKPQETTTSAPTPSKPVNQVTTSKNTTTIKKVLKKTKVTKATKKKTKLSIKFRKVAGAKSYVVQVSTSKKFKKILYKKTVKKVSVTLKSKKFKSKKKLYVRVRAKGAKYWSSAKKVKILKK